MSNYWKGKRVLVAGGAGMIGSYLCELLRDAGAAVEVVDPAGRYTETGRLVLEDVEAVEYAPGERPHVLFNLAAKVSGIGYNRRANYDMAQANLTPQLAAIRLAAAWGARLVQVSTACVYPHDAPVPTPEQYGWRGEPEPTNSGYGWAKRMGEMLTLWAVREKGLDAVIARPFNAYGPNDHFEDQDCHVIPALVLRALRGEDPLVIWGSGDQTRAFVHARDVAKGLMLLAEKAPTGTICNVGHDRQTSIRDLAHMVIARCWQPGLRLEFDRSKPDGYPSRGADPTLLREITGWVPDTPLSEGLDEVVEAARRYLKEVAS